jgi:hypothetical protein
MDDDTRNLLIRLSIVLAFTVAGSIIPVVLTSRSVRDWAVAWWTRLREPVIVGAPEPSEADIARLYGALRRIQEEGDQ